MNEEKLKTLFDIPTEQLNDDDTIKTLNGIEEQLHSEDTAKLYDDLEKQFKELTEYSQD